MTSDTETLCVMALPFDVADRNTWPEFMTVKEVAEVLRIHPSTVRNIAREPGSPIPLVEFSPQVDRIAKQSLVRLLDPSPDPPAQE